MIKIGILTLLLIASVGFFGNIQVVDAQINVNIPGALKNELNVDIIPNYPRPNENVFVTLSLYTDDLNSADIIWIKNGAIVAEGKGLTKYNFRTGAAGEETRVEVLVILKSGIKFNRSFTINPASVDITWEADSYTPPFYQGKALHPKQGRLKLVAMPEFYKDGKRISPENLTYSWSKGNESLPELSGFGKKYIVVDGNILGGQESFYVLVTDPNSKATAESYLDVSTTEPEILFYKNDPYYGYLYDQALPRVSTLDKSDIQLVVSPFFITRDGKSVKYEWKLNGQVSPDLHNSRTAVFKKPEEKEGESLVQVEVTNISKILQIGQVDAVIRFKK